MIPFSAQNGSIRRRRVDRTTSEKSEKETTAEPDDSKSKLIDEEEAAVGSVGTHVYGRYFNSIGIFMCIAAILSNALNQAASVYSGSNYRETFLNL